jgi:transcriptional regulator with GAF, ATPase, and Fis domain
MTAAREQLLVETFVTVADSLVVGYDVIDLLQTLVDRTVELFDASAAGIVLGTDLAHLEVAASSSEASRVVCLMQLSAGEGPCVEAVVSGRGVAARDATEMTARWPVFGTAASASGIRSVHSVPLRLRGEVIGCLDLFRDDEGELDETDAVAVRALADVATIGVLQERALRDGVAVRAQLQRALETRVVIEQAKGVIAYTHHADMDAAFRIIRDHARSVRMSLSDVAAGIVDSTIWITAARPPRP